MAGAIPVLFGIHTLSCDIGFAGSAIVVCGTIAPSNQSEPPPKIAYFLDKLSPSITTLPHATNAVPNQPLYAASRLSLNEEHVLLINVSKAQAPYVLNGFFVSCLESSNSHSMSFHDPPSPTTSPSASSTMVLDTDPHKTIMIVAGVLGSLLFLFIVGIVIFLILRWRMHARREQSERLRCAGESIFRVRSARSHYSICIL